MKLERFYLDYEQFSKGNIIPIEMKKPKKFSVKAFWDESFNRGYKIFKEKGVSLVEVFAWIPSVMGTIKLPDKLPEYISELLYEIYSFEFPSGSEGKDIRVVSFLNKYNLSNKELALHLKTRTESFLRKKLDLIGPAGIFCNCAIMDKDDNFVTKLFRINSDSISVDSGKKDDTFPKGSLGDVNGGSSIYKSIEDTDYIIKNILI